MTFIRNLIEKYLDIIIGFVTNYSLKLISAILVLVIGNWLAHKVSDLLNGLLERNKIDVTLSRFLANIVYYALLMLVVMTAAGQLGINTASFLTIIGTAGLAVGLALRDSLSNIAAGVMLIFFRPFKVGDVVNVSGVTGKVDRITIFSTHLITGDNQSLTVPNGSITKDVITNVTANPIRRIDMTIGVSYGENLALVKETLKSIVTADPRVLKEPEITIGVAELGESGVNLVVRPWVKTGEYFNVMFDLNQRIKEVFDEKGICIPFPQRDVHVYNTARES
jgi:small conductance mechanosensitive channel